MKSIIIVFILFMFVATSGVFAVSPSPSVTPSKSRALQLLITKAENRTQARIEDLEKLLERIDSDKKLSSDEKSSLSKEIKGLIGELNKFKDTFSSGSEAKGVRDLYKSVLEEKVYEYFVPKIRISVVISNLVSLEKRFEETVSKVNELVKDLKAKGKDTKTLEVDIKTLSDRLSIIKEMLETDKTKMTALTISSDYKQTFVAVRKDLAKVRSEFAKARSDVAKIKKDFKDLDGEAKAKPSTKPTVSPKVKL